MAAKATPRFPSSLSSASQRPPAGPANDPMRERGRPRMTVAWIHPANREPKGRPPVTSAACKLLFRSQSSASADRRRGPKAPVTPVAPALTSFAASRRCLVPTRPIDAPACVFRNVRKADVLFKLITRKLPLCASVGLGHSTAGLVPPGQPSTNSPAASAHVPSGCNVPSREHGCPAALIEG